MATLPLRWPGHRGERGRQREDGCPQDGTGRLCWRNWGKAGRVQGSRRGWSRPGPTKKKPGDELGCRASPCLAIKAPEQCVGCGGCLARVGSASGQDAGGLGRQWTQALGPFWSQHQCDSGTGRRPAQGGAAHWLYPKEISATDLLDRCNLPIPMAEIFPAWLELRPN